MIQKGIDFKTPQIIGGDNEIMHSIQLWIAIKILFISINPISVGKSIPKINCFDWIGYGEIGDGGIAINTREWK